MIPCYSQIINDQINNFKISLKQNFIKEFDSNKSNINLSEILKIINETSHRVVKTDTIEYKESIEPKENLTKVCS